MIKQSANYKTSFAYNKIGIKQSSLQDHNNYKYYKMDLSLLKKNALVCGGSKGIGKACAIVMAELGANVTIISRNPDNLQNALKELDKSKGQQHDFLMLDMSKPEDVRKRLIQHTSIKSYHILVNNTGGPAGGPILGAKESDFLEAFTQHLLANHIVTSLIVPGMKSLGYGRIINIISTSVKQPLENLGVSNTVRGAVANWAKTMANELAESGITVNNVLPGATHTERLDEIVKTNASKTGKSEKEVMAAMESAIPMKRIGRPEEIAAAVAFLATPAASYITGINVPVDGGRTKSL